MIPRYTRPEMGTIWSDENKFSVWLKIEVLACEAMHKLGVVPAKDLKQIQAKAAFNVKRINKIEEKVNHDVIAFLTNVAEHVGPSSRFIHRGLTSSDVLDTALAVQMLQAVDILIADLKLVRKAAAAKAKQYKYTPMIGRSHGVHAEPITFGLKMALMYDEFGRGLTRLEAARETIRVGQLSGAVGTHAHIDPFVEKYVCQKLGLKPAAISTQILQRDRHAEYISALENVALWHERDISHSSVERVIMPDSTIALDHMLVNLEKLVRNMVVSPDRMLENLNLTHGLIHSQQVLLMLTQVGFTREQAYRMVQRNAMAAWDTRTSLRGLIEADAEIMTKVTPADLDKVFDLKVHFRDVARTFKAVGL